VWNSIRVGRRINMDVRVGVPTKQKSVQITAATTTANIALPLDCDTVRVVAVAACYIAFGGSTVTATITTDLYMPAGHVESFRKDPTHTHMAAITGASTSVVTVTPMV
jgi:hypothetical protein